LNAQSLRILGHMLAFVIVKLDYCCWCCTFL